MSLQVDNVSKIFLFPKGITLTALDQVNMTIPEGAIYGLLGPNGAGKSTLISIVTGILLPTSGAVALHGVDVIRQPEKAKQLLGAVPQELVIEPAFTVEEVLYYTSGVYGVPRSERARRMAEVLEDLDLVDKRRERARNLSGGMKRRLMIAKAIMHRPRFLILDEPTAGVDVALRQKIWDLVRRLNRAGTTILFTTHYLEEAEQLCEAITFIDKGRVIKQGALSSIQQEFSKNAIHFELFDRTVPHASGVVAVGSQYEFSSTDLAVDMAALIRHYGSNIKNIWSGAPSLERIFLELTG